MRQSTRNRAALLGASASLALIGCAAMPPEQPPAWKVTPLYKLANGGDPVNARAYFALGQAQQGEGRWQQAAQSYNKAAFHDPDNAEAHHALGYSLAMLQRYDDAITEFDRAVALAPERAQYLNNLGYALLLSCQYDRAMRYLQAAVARDPAHAQALANITKVRELQASGLVQPTYEATGFAKDAPAAAEPAAAQAVAVVAPAAPAVSAVQAVPAPPQVSAPSDTPSRAAAAPAPVAGTATAATPGTAATPALATFALAERGTPRVLISNGNGLPGAASQVRNWLRAWLRSTGMGEARIANLKPYSTGSTVVRYQPGFAPQAEQLAQRLPHGVRVEAAPAAAGSADVHVVLGRDLSVALGCRSAACANGRPVTQAALAQAAVPVR